MLLAALPAAEPVVWDDPRVEWDDYDLVVLRSTWDYTERRDAFVAWCERVGPRLHNPPEVVRWNSDKRYLADLGSAGLPVVPTTFLDPSRPLDPLPVPSGPCVVKPAVSAGSRNTARHDGRASAADHAHRLLSEGRVVMVQPYIAGVDIAGETALLYYDGVFDHAIRKGPMLLSGAAAVEGLFAPEAMEPRTPRAAEIAVGDAVIAEVQRRFGRLLYARVDLLGEQPAVLELELIEPSLFLGHSDGAAGRFAETVTRRATRARRHRAPAARRSA